MVPFRLSAALGLLMALGGCVSNSTAITCPILLKYSPEFQRQALAELNAIHAPYLEQMLLDYEVTRDAISRCVQLRDKFR